MTFVLGDRIQSIIKSKYVTNASYFSSLLSLQSQFVFAVTLMLMIFLSTFFEWMLSSQLVLLLDFCLCFLHMTGQLPYCLRIELFLLLLTINFFALLLSLLMIFLFVTHLRINTILPVEVFCFSFQFILLFGLLLFKWIVLLLLLDFVLVVDGATSACLLVSFKAALD